MEHFNLILFSKINAGENLHGYKLWLSIFAAKYLIFVIVLWLLGVWLWGAPKHRQTLVLALSASLFALLINWGISLVWFHPRPFMLGVGHIYLTHASDSSFPSDHFTALCTIFFIFLWKESIRMMVIFLMLTTLIVAWARIYVGVHYPFDMLSGLAVSALSATVTIIYLSTFIKRYLTPISEYAYQNLSNFWHKKGE